MAILLTPFDLPVDAAKVRFQEPYVTAGLNQKTLGQQAKGVFAGFNVVPNGATLGVLIQIDATLGFSGANVVDTTSRKYCITIIQTANVAIDLTSVASSEVYIVLDAQYLIGAETTSQIKVVDAAELTNPNLVLLAKVNVPGSSPVLPSHIHMAYQLRSGDSVLSGAKPPVNLVHNSGFETDLNSGPAAGWAAFGAVTATASTDFAKSGTKSLKLVASGTGIANSAYMPVIPNESYRASSWVRTAPAGLVGTGLQFRVEWFDKGFVLIIGEDIETPVTGVVTTFTAKKALLIAPAQAAHARVQALFITTTGTAYLDDAEFSSSRVEALAHSPVFGGSLVVADEYHRHDAAGLWYGGGVAWADGTTNLGPVTIEAQLDKMLIDLSGASGAPKVGNAPSKILNNVFVTTVPNTASIDATGNGDKAGIVGRSGSTINTPGGLFISTAATAGPGLQAVGSGTGAGVEGYGGLSSNSYGGYFTSNSPGYGNGVRGQGVVTGAGVEGIGGVNALNFGGNILNPPTAGPGNGGTFMGATGDAGGDGIQAWGRSDANSRTGVLGVGAYPTISGTAGGAGVYGFGGTGGPGNTNGGNGVIGVSGSNTGTGIPGSGVLGNSNGVVGAAGVRGVGASGSAGVQGEAGAASGFGVRGLGLSFAQAIGVKGIAGPLGIGVLGEGTGSFSTGVKGVGSGNNTVGVFGTGTVAINSSGVSGQGGGTGFGGVFTGGELGGTGITAGGGTTSGLGASINGSSPNGKGATITGVGTGYGVAGVANGASIVGLTDIGVIGAGNIGVYGKSGANFGTGISGFGGPSVGPIWGIGVAGLGGSGDGIGVQATGQGAGWGLRALSNVNNARAVIKSEGHIWVEDDRPSGASNPTLNPGFKNTLTSMNVPKAWAYFLLNNTAVPTIFDSFNIVSISQVGSVITVNFVGAGNMNGGSYAVIPGFTNSSGGQYAYTLETTSQVATTFDFVITKISDGSFPGLAGSNNFRYSFVVFGRQP